jgi:hypothetical protein
VLAIIMQHGEVEGVDAAKIFGIENILAADSWCRLGTKIGPVHRKHRRQHRDARQRESVAAPLQMAGKLRIDQGIEDDTRRRLDLAYNAVDLPDAAHHRMDMLDRPHIGVLGSRRPRHRQQGLAGRIRNQMDVKKVLAAWHGPTASVQ